MPGAEQATCSVVGVGASAGGLDALRRLFSALPADPPFAVVVVQHLDPSTRSQLPEIIARSCRMNVVRAKSGDVPTPGTVYVVPEGRDAFLSKGKLRLRQRAAGCREPIDAFFTSLAQHHESAGCGVILSGSGADGVLGLREIRGAGGITLAQEPSTAEFPSMPLAAIDAGVCDFVGSPEQIARDLMAHVGRAPKVGSQRPAPKAAAQREARALAKILALVRLDSGMDFSGYKPTTVTRRIARRAMLKDAETFEAYLAVLEDEPLELATLTEDLLINVTQFFRDADVFEALRNRVLPELLKTKRDGDTLRIWAIGCSTGEEVYSLLITALEAMEEAELRLKITVFGTDASESAVARARSGAYPSSICASVSPERLSRYFNRTDAGYEIDRSLREMCVFARQDITKDTPFSRQDIVSLRNVLIYMDQPLQRRVLAVAHFALVPDGLLLLGTSETPDTEGRLFDAVDKRAHVYRRQGVASKLPADVANAAHVNIDALAVATPAVAFGADAYDAHTAANEMALLMYAPPRVVVDANGQVLHFFGDTTPFLKHAVGRATLDLAEMARPGIALELKDALEAATTADGRASREADFVSAGHKRHVVIEVTPLPSPPGETQLMVAFREPSATDELLAIPETNEDLSRLYESREQRVRGELGALRGRLRAISEEREQADQSLRSANEEIRSSNEELQSINEELETAKEELQSTNEELITVNDELRQTNRDLSLANDDVVNFMASIDVPVIMLDRSLRVRRFTPQAERVVRIENSDAGRLLEHLRLRVNLPDLPRIAAEVVETDRPQQLDVQDDNGRWYALSARPYRSADGVVDGVVLAFVDIDQIKRDAERLDRRARFGEALVSIDADLASTMRFDQIMQGALDRGVEAIGADAGTIEVREDDAWVVRYQHGFSPDDVGVRLTEAEAPMAVMTARLGTPLMVADTFSEPLINVGFVKSHKTRSALAIPLTVRGAAVGTLIFHRSRLAAGFTDDEVDFGRRLGTAASLALENARLVEAEREATRRAETLNAINEIVRSELTPSALLGSLVGDASRVAGADKCLVIECNGDVFTVTHARDVRDDVVGIPQRRDHFPAFAKATELGHPLLIGDTWTDPLTNKDFVVPYELRAFELLPLVVDDSTRAIVAFAYDEPRTFDEADRAFADRVCVAMSVALANALLYESEVRARESASMQLETTALLLRVAAVLAGSGDLISRLSTTADLVVGGLMHDRVVVTLWDEEARRASVVAARGGPNPAQLRFAWEELSAAAREAIETARTVIVDYVGESERIRRLSAEAGFRLAAMVPMVHAGRVLGLFTVDQPARINEFTPREIGLLESFAAQAATAVDNDRLYAAEAERAKRMALLKELADAASSLDSRAVAASVVESALAMLGARQAQIRLISSDGTMLEPVASAGWPEGFLEQLGPIPVNAQMETARCFRDGKGIASGDLSAAKLSKQSRRNMRDAGVRSCIVVPIHSSDRPIGTLYVAWGEARRFAAEEVSFVEAIAGQFAIGVQNAFLFEAEKTSREREEVLHELTELATSSLDLTEVAESALTYIHQRLDVDVLTYWMLDGTGSRLLPLSGVGFPQEFYDDFSLGIGIDDDFEVAGAVRSDRVIVRDHEHIGEVPPAVRTAYAKFGVDLQALLVVPVKGHTGVLGAVTLAWAHARALDSEDVRFFSSVANELAIATDNATLFAEKERELVRTAILQTVATATSSTLSLDEVCKLALEQVRMLPEVAACAIYLLDDQRTVLRSLGEFGYPEDVARAIAVLPVDDTSNPGRVVLHDLPLLTHENSGNPPEATARLAAMGVPSARWIALPIRSNGVLIGEIGFIFHGERSFETQEITLYTGIADTLAASMANAGLHQDLLASQHRVTSILESIGDGFYALDRDWCFTYANAEAGRMIGVPHGELIGMTMGEVLDDPKVFEFQKQVFAPAMDYGQVIELERYFPQTGIWAEVRVFPSPEGVAVYGHDVTERKAAEEALRESRARAQSMATFLDESSQPFGVGNLDGSVGLVNRAYEELTGYTSEELSHLSWSTTLTPPEYRELEASKLAELLATGEPVRYEKEFVRKDGSRVPVELLVHLDTDEDGNPKHYYAFVTNLTQRKELERLDVVFNEVRTAIGSTLEYAEILRVALQAGARALGADSAAVVVPSPHGWRIAESLGGQVPPIDAPGAELVVAPVVAFDGQPLLSNKPVDDPRLNGNLVRTSRLKAIAAAPLGIKRAELGVLAFAHRKKRGVFTEDQFEFVVRLARVVALAIQNSMLYERERKIADTLQESLLAPPETIPGIETSFLYRAASDSANVGGDFFEVFSAGENRCLIVVGDVSGKGLEAAQLTSLLHDGIRAYALETTDPIDILTRLNRLVCHLSPPEQFATVFLGLLDVDTGRLRFCTAGHPPPLVINRNGASYLLSTRSPVLGAFPQAPFHTLETVIAVGERLVLFTDGVTEARRGSQLLGDERLLKMATKLAKTPTPRLPQRLLKMVLDYSSGHLRDDTVILCVERAGMPSDADAK